MKTVYVGRWDLIPHDWPQIELRGLMEMSEATIAEEVKRQKDLFPKPAEGTMDSYHFPGALIGDYTPEEFEATFNEDMEGLLNTRSYWIRIF